MKIRENNKLKVPVPAQPINRENNKLKVPVPAQPGQTLTHRVSFHC